MTIEVGAGTMTIAGVAFLALQSLVFLLISERLKASLKRENDKFLENLRWDFKVREQAARVAEYMALAHQLKPDSSEEDYRTANRFAWELAMWLPPDVYKALAQALIVPSKEVNILSIVIQVRKILLGDQAGNLIEENIISHAPNIGRNRQQDPSSEQETPSQQ